MTLASSGSVASAKPRADEGVTSQQTKRGRGRPRLRDTPTSPPPADKAQQTKRGRGRPRLRDSRTSTSLQKGRKQEDTTTPKKGRPRKKESKNPRNKPGSVLIPGDKVSPQPQLSSPQNGEGLLHYIDVRALPVYIHMIDKVSWGGGG